MLVLSRKLNEKIVIDGGIVVTVVKIDRNQVRLGIEAPRNVRIFREEIAAADGHTSSERPVEVGVRHHRVRSLMPGLPPRSSRVAHSLAAWRFSTSKGTRLVADQPDVGRSTLGDSDLPRRIERFRFGHTHYERTTRGCTGSCRLVHHIREDIVSDHWLRNRVLHRLRLTPAPAGP